MPVLLFSIIIHECAHGYTAYHYGDDTAYLSGRLTLNPIPHIDKIGSIAVPLVCAILNMPTIGWAKPVPVNPHRLRNPRRDMAKVALSGPLANIALIILAAIGLRLIVAFSSSDFSLFVPLAKIFYFTIMLNLVLAIFNLIPIFPLDGSQILLGVLKGEWLEKYERHIPYGMYIILGLVLTGAVKYIIVYPMMLFLNLLTVIGIMPRIF